jgi:formyl-CoA transferase
MGGLRYVVGDPSTPPSRVGISIGDSLAATFACLGALSALHSREQTGRGQVVDSAIYESVLAMMESLITEYDKTGYVRERTGAILPKIAPSNVYPTRDGDMVLIGANQDTVFGRLTEAMGEPALAQDPKFSTHVARGSHQEEIDARVAKWTATLTADDLLARLDEAGVPAGRIYRAPDMIADPHFQAREAIVEVETERFGKLKMQNAFPRLSRTPSGIRSPAPSVVGQHNAEIYGGLLGLGEAEIAELAAKGAI